MGTSPFRSADLPLTLPAILRTGDVRLYYIHDARSENMTYDSGQTKPATDTDEFHTALFIRADGDPTGKDKAGPVAVMDGGSNAPK